MVGGVDHGGDDGDSHGGDLGCGDDHDGGNRNGRDDRGNGSGGRPFLRTLTCPVVLAVLGTLPCPVGVMLWLSLRRLTRGGSEVLLQSQCKQS